MSREDSRELVARALVCALFGLLSINILSEFLRTGHITGLLLLASESLVVVLTLVRRRARIIDRSAAAAITTTVSMVGAPLLRTGSAAPLMPDVVTAIISACGLIIVVLGKMTLGRSFGLVPANRGVVARGPYLVVRHPIYLGYVITHIAFVVAHPSTANIVCLVVMDTALIARALIEERVLGGDIEYQAYCQRVAWHLVPGVF